MKAVKLQEIDGPDALTEEPIPRPEPVDDELLIRVHATSVNPLDWLICRGILPGLLDEPLPWIPGWDLSGVVDSVGERVSEFQPGDEVYGMVRLPGAGGTYAEYATMTADEVASKPDSLSHHQAAAVPMVGQTAFHALFEAADVDAGQRVLIHAAAGGIGHMAVQLAKSAGAEVVSTASGRNESYLWNLGVDEFVNYRAQQFEDETEPVDVVIDAIGGEVLERSAEVVRPGGTIVTLPEPPAKELVKTGQHEPDVSIRYFSVTDDAAPATLQRVSDSIESGELEPTVSETYPLSEAAAAVRKIEGGHVRGKLVLTVGDD